MGLTPISLLSFYFMNPTEELPSLLNYDCLMQLLHSVRAPTDRVPWFVSPVCSADRHNS